MKYYPTSVPHFPPPFDQSDEVELSRSIAKGRSIHIGLNSIDITHYGVGGYLRGCENDARAMDSIAATYGYERKVLLTKDATTANVFRELMQASQQLESGDTLLLTYAGHGSQVPDTNGDEKEGQDQTWCLYDRMLVDDELYRMWALFKLGVRVVVVSDSCHSGTVLRELLIDELLPPGRPLGGGGDPAVQYSPYRELPPNVAATVYSEHSDLYDSIQWSGTRGDMTPVVASVVLLAACQDNQTALDGQNDGLFTQEMLGVWNKGTFTGSYVDFIAAITKRMPATQSPNFFQVGLPDSALIKQTPFTLFSNLSALLTPQSMNGSTPSISRSLQDGPTNGQNSQRCLFRFDVDRTSLDGKSDDDLRKYFQSEGTDMLLRAYKAISAIAVPRDGEFRGGFFGCDVVHTGHDGMELSCGYHS